MKTLVVSSRPPTQNNHKGETVAGLWEQQHAGRFTAETRDRKCLRDDVLKTVDMLGLLYCIYTTVCVILWRHLSQHDDVTSFPSPSQFFVTSG